MHHDIHTSACSLIFRKRHCQFRIHNREFRSAITAVVSPFQPPVFICDHRRITHLRTCRRNRKYNSDWQTSASLTFSLVKIPYIPFVLNAVSNRFRRVDHTSASDCQNKIYALSPAQIDSFIYKRQSGVRNDASKRNIRNPFLIKRCEDPIKKAASFYTSAPVMNKHLPAVLLFDKLSCFIFRTFSKHNFCRRIILKIFHHFFPPFRS